MKWVVWMIFFLIKKMSWCFFIFGLIVNWVSNVSIHAHVCTCRHMQNMHTSMHMWCSTHAHKHTNKCVSTHTPTHMHVCVCMHMHSHTHTLSLSLSLSLYVFEYQTSGFILCCRFVCSLVAVTARQHATVQWQWSQVMMSSCLIAVGHSKGKQMDDQFRSRCWSMENSQLAPVSFAGMMERPMRSVWACSGVLYLVICIHFFICRGWSGLWGCTYVLCHSTFCLSLSFWLYTRIQWLFRFYLYLISQYSCHVYKGWNDWRVTNLTGKLV